MTIEKQKVSLGQAALSFLASLPPKEGGESQQEVNRFVLWYGKERAIRELTAPEVANYAQTITASSPDSTKRLASVRAFLSYAKKEGLTETNLATHLKAGKGLPKAPLARKASSKKSFVLTPQGYAQLKSELAALQEERPRIVEEIRKAAADKDFRENAPLEAAREQQGQVEARIREIETTLRSAAVSQEKPVDKLKVRVGSRVTLQDLSSGEKLSYTLVSPNEVDPTKGKISLASPIGKALLDRQEGEAVEVTAPFGKLHYRIERIEL